MGPVESNSDPLARGQVGFPKSRGIGMREQEAERWLSILTNLGRAPNTILAYRRALDDYLDFCTQQQKRPEHVDREQIALFVRFMAERPVSGRSTPSATASRSGLANATIHLRLTAVRLYHDHLVEEGIRPDNPVGRGRYTPHSGFGGARRRALVPRYTTLPWIPNDAEWRAMLEAAREGPLRNRLMLGLAYDAGLRREDADSDVSRPPIPI